MRVLENYSLKELTSMYVGGPARYFVEVSTMEDVKDALLFSKNRNIPFFILGGGSNIIVSDSGFVGLVIKINIKGIEHIESRGNEELFRVGAGENWDGFVDFTIEGGLYGIENLSHIPGTVGASVVQNIGAYGAEVSTSVLSVNVINTETLEEEVLNNVDLKFSYRKSILNTSLKGKYIVTSVLFVLKSNGFLNMQYDDIKKFFSSNPNIKPSIQTLRQAIINIRNSKFPYPDFPQNGSVGSFWNADVINEETYQKIILKLESMGFMDKANMMRNKKSVFTVSQGYKVPYGILIEVLGFKGRVVGGVKILESHSGVINNFTGKGTSKDVMGLSDMVRGMVREEFGVNLNIEPELVGEF